MGNLEAQVIAQHYGQRKEQCKVLILQDTYLEPQYLLGLHLKDHGSGGHGSQSQHYAGVAFDAGQTLSNSERNRLRNTASSSGVWSYVEPAYLTPTWVHFDRRFGRPACGTAGYPLIKRGSVSTYVLIAQDDLNTLGFRTGGLDGIFGARTAEAVRNYQRSRGLAQDGIVGCNTWRSLQEDVVGTGRTSTTID